MCECPVGDGWGVLCGLFADFPDLRGGEAGSFLEPKRGFWETAPPFCLKDRVLRFPPLCLIFRESLGIYIHNFIFFYCIVIIDEYG